MRKISKRWLSVYKTRRIGRVGGAAFMIFLGKKRKHHFGSKFPEDITFPSTVTCSKSNIVHYIYFYHEATINETKSGNEW